MTIITYFQFIFQFLIVLGGLIAILVLVVNGIFYITSAGKPEKIKEAQKWIFSAILGLIILVSSYLILNTINPQLVSFRLPGIEKLPRVPVSISPPSHLPPGTTLSRIRVLAEAIKNMTEKTENMAEQIKNLTNGCDCKYTWSLCLCSGGDAQADCQPHQCYIEPYTNPTNIVKGATSHPCPFFWKIKELQKSIVDHKDVLSYYGNRASVESEDLDKDIELVVSKKIEQIEFANELLEILRKEKNYKLALKERLINLAAVSIPEIETAITEIAELPGQCLSGVAGKCKPTCKTGPYTGQPPPYPPYSKDGQDYGCHDKVAGCQGDKCISVNPNNSNPCPDKLNPEDTDPYPNKAIKTQAEKIKNLKERIVTISKKMIDIVNDIEKL